MWKLFFFNMGVLRTLTLQHAVRAITVSAANFGPNIRTNTKIVCNVYYKVISWAIILCHHLKKLRLQKAFHLRPEVFTDF